MQRGEIWLARLNPNSGTEVGKILPVLVMLADELIAAGLTPILCIPLTTKLFKGTEALRLTIPARKRLIKKSYLMMEQARALDVSRFGDGPLATLNEAEMTAVEHAFLGMCGMAHYIIPPH